MAKNTNIKPLSKICFPRHFDSSLFATEKTLNNEYIERIHQMSYSSLCDNGMFFLNDYMELFKTVPAYSWLFIYFRKY